MAAKDYATLALFVDQDYMVEITNVELATESGEQRVDLLKEGFGGFSPGAGACTMNISFTVPKGGAEYDWQPKCARKEWVTMQLVVGDKQYVGLGKLLTVNISQSVNAPVEGTASWDGELSPLQ